MIKVYQVEDEGEQVWYPSRVAANTAGYEDADIVVVTLRSANRDQLTQSVCAIHNGSGGYALSEKPL